MRETDRRLCITYSQDPTQKTPDIFYLDNLDEGVALPFSTIVLLPQVAQPDRGYPNLNQGRVIIASVVVKLLNAVSLYVSLAVFIPTHVEVDHHVSAPVDGLLQRLSVSDRVDQRSETQAQLPRTQQRRQVSNFRSKKRPVEDGTYSLTEMTCGKSNGRALGNGSRDTLQMIVAILAIGGKMTTTQIYQKLALLGEGSFKRYQSYLLLWKKLILFLLSAGDSVKKCVRHQLNCRSCALGETEKKLFRVHTTRENFTAWKAFNGKGDAGEGVQFSIREGIIVVDLEEMRKQLAEGDNSLLPNHVFGRRNY
mmetsp:Transcript_42506/g.109277  ORF Transcript_42506/g.109277 Transcript_42506/m.109277 type:complete len:309 (-) Transcript_42506:112-1038(-)